MTKDKFVFSKIYFMTHQMRILWLTIIAILFASISLKAQDKKYQVAIIGFYNLENLYDTINDPLKNDEEFLPKGVNKYTSEIYLEKLSHLSEAISKIGADVNKSGPTIMGFSEIENIHVIEDLINMPLLKKNNYGIVHYDSPDIRGVDVGFIYQKSRFKVIGSSSHRLITADTSFITRDQLLVQGLLDGEEIYVIVNHWPSKRGGEKRSEPKRVAAAELTRHLSDSLHKINPKVNVIIMGDLNDNPNAKSIAKTLKAKGDKSEMKDGELFNPMWKLYKDGIGSYAYRDSWTLIDNIIVSNNLIGNDFSTYKLYVAKVFNETFLQQREGTFKGYPWRMMAGGSYIGGYSDHFPVYIILAKTPKQ